MVALSSCRSIVRLKFVDRGAVNLGSSPTNPNPMGSNWEKSMVLSPTGNGVKGNGVVSVAPDGSTQGAPVAVRYGLAKPTEPHAAPAPAEVIAKGALVRVCSANSSSLRL